MTTDYVVSLSNRANQAQSKAREATCFEELMTRIAQAYRFEIASSRVVYSDEPEKLKDELDFWQGLIDVTNKAIAANKQAFATAQVCPDYETGNSVMKSELEAFIEVNNPGFEMYMQDGDWWADVEY
ncbi:MAG: hypothetical protein KME45_03135 [Stenomitos rutilans HA7619-LM2]|jgi:hypothetical protein|nr:hypothetical protein [Stenomitos rutilans HA7619-LM2]MBW4469379.1 hypothetical protein [Stenomitos rutilans HA7619-LM2]